MTRISALWRHPIKAHGRESLDHVALIEGRTMPWDRRWAVAHAQAKADGSVWAPCANFSRGAKVAQLMAIEARLDEAAGLVTLSHPDRPDLTFDPDGDEAAFLEWVRPLMPADRAQSTSIVRAPDRGMTDTDFPSISLLNTASHADVCDRMGRDLSLQRWRGNIHLDGLAPWAERDWIGRSLRIGTARIDVRENIVRCMATTANPATGQRDADTLGALKSNYGHQEFGVYGVVTQGGTIAVGDTIEVI
ncbi:MOSC domain-containing protein [Rhodobacteraceae bacterium KMM 6894]|nr:MOSC domain-containing protein [Rhodobacteraceae bacterium KMM 6894]